MRVAVLGLGRMGSAIAERLAQAGHELFVWNRSPAATAGFARDGATVLEHPRAAPARAELVITMLADDDAVRAVTLGEQGVLSGDGDAVLIDMSTISARASAQVAQACEQRRIAYLRAPVTGNPGVVAAGNLGIIVSGPIDTFERLTPTLRSIGPNLFHVGEGEQARIVKLALNLILGGTTQLLAEALVLAEHSGIETARMLDVVCGSAIGSPFVKYKSGPLIAGDYSSTFTASMLFKDLALALEAGHDASVPLPLTAATQQLVQGAIARGMGELDLSALIPRLRLEAGERSPEQSPLSNKT
ncbi:MAG: NAD(P)-dependent oxidoreductase [Solirubrobacteraceae bacterium]